MAGVQQLLVVGRRIVTQHDFVPPSESKTGGSSTAAAGHWGRFKQKQKQKPQERAAAADGSTAVTLTQVTNFPYPDADGIQIKIAVPSKKSVAFRLRLRMPSWAFAIDGDTAYTIPVQLNGKNWHRGAPGPSGHGDPGVPGSFLKVHNDRSHCVRIP